MPAIDCVGHRSVTFRDLPSSILSLKSMSQILGIHLLFFQWYMFRLNVRVGLRWHMNIWWLDGWQLCLVSCPRLLYTATEVRHTSVAATGSSLTMASIDTSFVVLSGREGYDQWRLRSGSSASQSHTSAAYLAALKTANLDFHVTKEPMKANTQLTSIQFSAIIIQQLNNWKVSRAVGAVISANVIDTSISCLL